MYISRQIFVRINAAITPVKCIIRLHSKMSCSKQGGNDWTTKFALPPRYQGSEQSIWIEYKQVVYDYQPLDLGAGFPDYGPPPYLSEALSCVAKTCNNDLNQYSRSFGHPRLVEVLSKLYSQLLNREIDPNNDIIITVGGYEALYCAIVGNVHTGDEVIIMEPYFDCYDPMVRNAGGTPRFIALKPSNQTGSMHSSDWVLDMKELASTFNEKTKIIIVNTPQNPSGKVFSECELIEIADLCKKWNVLCLADEVYEWLVYEPHTHIRMASLPGMWERTLTLGSAGKVFNITGWKIGWIYGPANLMANLQMVHQNCVYTCATPLQEAVAIGFETELDKIGTCESYFTIRCKEVKEKRNFMVKCLTDIGMRPTIPDGGFFMLANWTPLASGTDLSKEPDEFKDYKFTKWMAKNIRFLAIPTSAFYTRPHKHLGEEYIRLCYIKTEETLKKAEKVLHGLKKKSK